MPEQQNNINNITDLTAEFRKLLDNYNIPKNKGDSLITDVLGYTNITLDDFIETETDDKACLDRDDGTLTDAQKKVLANLVITLRHNANPNGGYLADPHVTNELKKSLFDPIADPDKLWKNKRLSTEEVICANQMFRMKISLVANELFQRYKDDPIFIKEYDENEEKGRQMQLEQADDGIELTTEQQRIVNNFREQHADQLPQLRNNAALRFLPPNEQREMDNHRREIDNLQQQIDQIQARQDASERREQQRENERLQAEVHRLQGDVNRLQQRADTEADRIYNSRYNGSRGRYRSRDNFLDFWIDYQIMRLEIDLIYWGLRASIEVAGYAARGLFHLSRSAPVHYIAKGFFHFLGKGLSYLNPFNWNIWHTKMDDDTVKGLAIAFVIALISIVSVAAYGYSGQKALKSADNLAHGKKVWRSIYRLGMTLGFAVQGALAGSDLLVSILRFTLDISAFSPGEMAYISPIGAVLFCGIFAAVGAVFAKYTTQWFAGPIALAKNPNTLNPTNAAKWNLSNRERKRLERRGFDVAEVESAILQIHTSKQGENDYSNDFFNSLLKNVKAGGLTMCQVPTPDGKPLEDGKFCYDFQLKKHIASPVLPRANWFTQPPAQNPDYQQAAAVSSPARAAHAASFNNSPTQTSADGGLDSNMFANTLNPGQIPSAPRLGRAGAGAAAAA